MLLFGTTLVASAHDWRLLLSTPCLPEHFDVHFYPGGHEFMTHSSAPIFQKVCTTISVVTPRAEVQQAAVSRDCTVHSPLHTVRWVPTAVTSSNTSTSPLPALSISLGSDIASLNEEHRLALSQGRLVVELFRDFTAAVDPSGWVDLEAAMCARLMTLVQQVCAEGVPAGSRLILLLPASMDGSMTAGFSKAVPMEDPDLHCVRIFIPGDRRTSFSAQHAVALSARYPTETDLWVEGDTVAVPRLFSEPVIRAKGSFRLPHGCSYLVTGGRGGIGSKLVDWLLDGMMLPPSSIILLVRKSKALTAPSHPRGVRIIEADISDAVNLCSNLELGKLQHVGGIFHLAGSLDDGLVINMNETRLRTPIVPKSAALHLLELVKVRGWAPRWLVCFSSTSSLFGFHGQSNYCAANALLDHMAMWPPTTAERLRIISVNWGPWEEVGMAAVGSKAHAQAVKDGERPLSTQVNACAQVFYNFFVLLTCGSLSGGARKLGHDPLLCRVPVLLLSPVRSVPHCVGEVAFSQLSGDQGAVDCALNELGTQSQTS